MKPVYRGVVGSPEPRITEAINYQGKVKQIIVGSTAIHSDDSESKPVRAIAGYDRPSLRHTTKHNLVLLLRCFFEVYDELQNTPNCGTIDTCRVFMGSDDFDIIGEDEALASRTPLPLSGRVTLHTSSATSSTTSSTSSSSSPPHHHWHLLFSAGRQG